MRAKFSSTDEEPGLIKLNASACGDNTVLKGDTPISIKLSLGFNNPKKPISIRGPPSIIPTRSDLFANKTLLNNQPQQRLHGAFFRKILAARFNEKSCTEIIETSAKVQSGGAIGLGLLQPLRVTDKEEVIYLCIPCSQQFTSEELLRKHINYSSVHSAMRTAYLFGLAKSHI